MCESFSLADLLEIGSHARAAARLAGQSILGFYGSDVSFSSKTDGSPLTRADQASHEVIVQSLSKLGFPIVSEEAPETVPSGACYWLVDPLDGTKDFLEHNDEFTVNIALIENDKPVLGVLYAPALDELYFGVMGGPVWMESEESKTPCDAVSRSTGLRMAISRFHDHPDTQSLAKANQVEVIVPIGAALKYGRLAMGEIDFYPRMVGTSEWDTAAGQAILQAAGGCLLDWETGKPLLYGKANRRNGRFLAFRAPYCHADFKTTIPSHEPLHVQV